MKTRLIRLLVVVCLTAAPFTPALAGTATDEDLEVVGARGLEQLNIADQAGVLSPYPYQGSVVMTGNAQKGGRGMVLENVAVSNVNVGQNIAGGNMVGSGAQVNEQAANNQTEALAGYGAAEKTNYYVVDLTGSAQSSSQTMALVNTAGSAANIGQNMLSATASGPAAFSQTNSQRATDSFTINQVFSGGQTRYPIPTIPDSKEGTVEVADSSQSGASSMAILNAAVSAVNVGQNVANLGGMMSMLHVQQVNSQEAKNKSSVIETITIDETVKSVSSAAIGQQINTSAIGNAQGAQSDVATVLLANLADASVNVGANILNVGKVLSFSATQLNRQMARNDFGGLQDNYFVFYDTNNNNAAIQVRGSAQVGSNGVGLINASESAMNLGQNLASTDAGGLLRQQNLQTAGSSEYWANSLPILSEGLIENCTMVQRNNSNSVQVLGGQSDSSFMSFNNAASAAINVGQNVARMKTMTQALKTQQDNSQYTSNVVHAIQYLDNAFSDSIGGESGAQGKKTLTLIQDNNLGSVQMKDGGQNGSSGLAIDNTAASALNIGQNFTYLKSQGMTTAYQTNGQRVYASGYLGQLVENGVPARVSQNNNNGSLQILGSMDGMNGLSISSLTASAANIGQNLANIDSGMGTTILSQTNYQKTMSSTTAEQEIDNAGYAALKQENNNGSVRFVDSGNNVTAGSFLNASLSAVNVGLNMASVDAKEATVKQMNGQSVYNNASGTQEVNNYGDAKGQTENNISVQLAGSQNGVHALSLANLAGSAANIGQNIANVNGASIDVTQVNKQDARAVTSATQRVSTSMEASGVTTNNGSVDLSGSQNWVSGLSIVNAALSAINVGQNIASVTGKDVSIHQVNCQVAKTDTGEVQTVTERSGVMSQSNSSSVVLDSSQANTSAMLIANVAGSAVNYGQNIISISGAKGGSLYQTNVQKAW